MGRTATLVLVTTALLAGCKPQQASRANASGNAVTPSAEAGTAPARPLDKAAIIKQRQDKMKALDDATKKAASALQSAKPDTAAIKQFAAAIAALAPRLTSWFPAGTGPDAGKTRAKPEIWQKQEDFALKAHDFVQASNDFSDAAQSGDLTRIKASFGGLEKTCNACHGLYLAPDKH